MPTVSLEMPTLARVFALGKVALSNHNSLGPSPSSTQSPQPLSSASAPVFPERQPLRGYPAAGARGPPVFPAPSPLPQAGTTQAQCGRGGRSLSRHRPTGCEHHGGRGEAYGSIRSSAVLDPPGAPRPPVGHLGPAAPPWPVDAPGPAGAPAPSPVPPTRPLRVARASPGLPLGSAAVPESAVLSGFGTGEHPEEGHDPDAAARAGAGDRKRPPQRRGRPFTGTAGARWGRRVGGGWGGVLPVCLPALLQTPARPQPLEMARGLRASRLVRLFCLAGPPALQLRILSKVFLLPLIRQKAPTPGPGALFSKLAQVSGLPRKLQMWRWVIKVEAP